MDTCFAGDADPNYAPVLGAIQPFPQAGAAACGVPLGAVAASVPTSTLNVAVKTRSGGVCGASGCYVVFDAAASGYSVQNAPDGTPWAILPPGICRRSRKDQAKAEADRAILGVVVSPTCLTKPADQPFCNGAWQADNATSGCADGHGWDGTGHNNVPVGGPDASPGSDASVACIDIEQGASALTTLSGGRLAIVQGMGSLVVLSDLEFAGGCLTGATRTVVSPAPANGTQYYRLQAANDERTAFSAVPRGYAPSGGARIVTPTATYAYVSDPTADTNQAFGAYAYSNAGSPTPAPRHELVVDLVG